MAKSVIHDSGVSFRGDGFVLYHHTRRLYYPFFLQVFDTLNLGHYIFRLSGCMLKRCKFPTITCDKCAFCV